MTLGSDDVCCWSGKVAIIKYVVDHGCPVYSFVFRPCLLLAHTMHTYVAFLCASFCLYGTKCIVFFPVGMRIMKPCANRLISFACDISHFPPSLPLRSTSSSTLLPVFGSTAAPVNRETLATVVVVNMSGNWNTVFMRVISIRDLYTY